MHLKSVLKICSYLYVNSPDRRGRLHNISICKLQHLWFRWHNTCFIHVVVQLYVVGGKNHKTFTHIPRRVIYHPRVLWAGGQDYFEVLCFAFGDVHEMIEPRRGWFGRVHKMSFLDVDRQSRWHQTVTKDNPTLKNE